MNDQKKLVDYSLSASDFEEDRPTPEEPTPIQFKGRRVFLRIIRSPSPVPTKIRRFLPAPKRWTVNEGRKLKLALKICNPTKDSDWDSISRSMGGCRTAEECRAKAIRECIWKQSSSSSSSSSSTTMVATATNVESNSSAESDAYSKFFRENVDFSLSGLDLDDTLLNVAYGSPPEPVKCMRRPFLLRPIDPLEDERVARDSDNEENDG